MVTVPEGGYVFRAGDAADSFFIVSSGQVELLRRGETHRRLALLGAGDLCGEDSAFEGEVRSCDARAATPATLLRVSTAAFPELVRLRPELASVMISRTAMRLLQARAAALAIALPPAGAGAAPGSAPPRFVHLESGSQFPLSSSADTVVGRADPRAKTQPDVELTPVDTHRSLSRRHAVVRRAGGLFEVAEEPRVANGTFVNGTRLKAGVATAIRDGDEVSFGLVRTVFRTT